MGREADGIIQLQFIGNLINAINAADGDPQATWGEALDTITLTTGAEDDQINRAVSKKSIALASAGTLTLDVFDFAGFDVGGGDGRDQLGQTLALNEVVGVLVVLHKGSNGALKIGAEGSGACWNSMFDGRDDAGVVIRATAANPGVFLLASPSTTGYEVTDGSNHLLKFEAIGGSVTFSLHLIGRDNP